MRDHLLGHPANARAVQGVTEPDEWGDCTDTYPLGIPSRVARELIAEPKEWRERLLKRVQARQFQTGNHANPDGSVTPCPARKAKISISGFGPLRRTDLGNLSGTRVQEQAAAALAVPLRARTAVQAADRMGEAFAHMEAAKG